MASIQSTTGYFSCPAESEECDDTDLHCLGDRESHTKCPRHTDVECMNESNEKSQTVPATRILVARSWATLDQGHPSVNTEKLYHNPEASYSIPSPSEVTSVGTSPTATDASNRWTSWTSSSGSAKHSSIDSDTSHLLVDPADHDPVVPPQDFDIPSQHFQHTADPTFPLVSNRSTHEIGQHDDIETHEDENEDVEGVVSLIRRNLVLDRTAESNALPFVIQGYFAWISRLALDPLKMAGGTRDFVFGQFEGGEQSRWTIALLANVGSRIGSAEFIEGRPNHLLSMLQTSVRRRLGAANPDRLSLIKALDSAVETMTLQFYASPINEAMTLIQEAAPVFRQLCPGPPGAAIQLQLLLQNPLECLWHYAYIDIIFSVLTDMPSLCRYELATPGSQPILPYSSANASHSDGVIQWLHGVPNQLVLLLAHMRTMRGDGIIPNGEMVASIERSVREIPVFDGSSSERFLGIIRSIVQECWKQASLIYFYMAVCGDPSDKPRVKEAFKRYMRLFNGTQPGRMPDEFLILTLQLVCPAAQRPRDRAVIKQRALGLYTRDRTHISTTFITFIMDDVWARADAEGRPIMWSDIAVSRRRLLGA